MADTFSKVKRSEIMRAVKSRGNRSTELKLIKIFKKYSVKGWRRNYRLFGNPDFAFPKKKVVIFTDGCFWHGHNCRNVKPSDNFRYWERKIRNNKSRDRKVTSLLKIKGWKVVRLWECQIKKDSLPKKIEFLLNNDNK